MAGTRLGRIVAYALSRREAYLIVGLVFVAVVVAIVGGWPGWVILAAVGAGVLLLALLILDSLGDPNAEREASMAGVEPGRIRDRDLRSRLLRAMEYVRAAQRLAAEDRARTLDAADDELPQMEEAIRSIYQMSLRLQEFRADALIQRDLASIRQQRPPRERLTEAREAQMETLRRLDNLVRSAEQELDSSLAHLGRSYAEMQAMKVTPELRGQAAGALDELKESTQRLSDLAAGYDEVFGGGKLSRDPRAGG